MINTKKWHVIIEGENNLVEIISEISNLERKVATYSFCHQDGLFVARGISQLGCYSFKTAVNCTDMYIMRRRGNSFVLFFEDDEEGIQFDKDISNDLFLRQIYIKTDRYSKNMPYVMQQLREMKIVLRHIVRNLNSKQPFVYTTNALGTPTVITQGVIGNPQTFAYQTTETGLSIELDEERLINCLKFYLYDNDKRIYTLTIEALDKNQNMITILNKEQRLGRVTLNIPETKIKKLIFKGYSTANQYIHLQEFSLHYNLTDECEKILDATNSFEDVE